ncbi:MAG TPA: NAD(P)-dependent oxidoreductase [Acidimicrobiales bacterium]|nr:NAD(P)-dependent oxidoreductase [Acidimicrobiales bacterium]
MSGDGGKDEGERETSDAAVATRVGFIGLGSQGAPMAHRIAEEGFPLAVWGRRPETTSSFAGTAAIVASPRQVAATSDIVCVCVVADRDVEEVVLGADGVLAGMAPGGILVIHSTVRPDTCSAIAEEATAVGVSVVDAPVSGGGGAAAERRLLVMAGGERAALERCRPVFETFSGSIIHLGPLGSGQMAKLLNNLVFTAQITVALETYSFADRLGIDRRALAEVLAAGSGGSRAAAIIAASGFDTTGLRQHALPLLVKDTGIMREVAEARGAAPPEKLDELARHTLALLAALADAG